MGALPALLVALLTACAARTAFAQSVRGTVLEDTTRTPVSGATVTALRAGTSESFGARTDSTGAFVIALRQPGRFLVRVEHPSYLSFQSDTLPVAEEEVVTLELRMGRNAIPLQPLVVTARVDKRLRDFRLRAEKSGFGHFLLRGDIERRRGLRPTELLRTIPGVRIIPTPTCAGCSPQDVVYMRGGSAPCLPTVLIDGLMVRQDEITPLDALIQADELEGIEVYSEPGTIPPELTPPNASCGLVALWTRTPEGGKLTWKRLAVAAGIVLVVFLLVR